MSTETTITETLLENPPAPWLRMAGAYPSLYFPSLKTPIICATAIQRWLLVFSYPKTMEHSLITSDQRRFFQKTFQLPDPCEPLRKSLKRLEEKALQYKKSFESARRIATTFEFKHMEIRQKYRTVDYRLALMDGRMKIVKPHRPDIRQSANPPQKVNIAKLLNRLSGRQKEELLKELLK